MAEPNEPGPTRKRRRRQLYALLIVALLAAVAAGVLMASSVWTNKFNDEEKASEAVPANAVVESPERKCAAPSVYDAIKREIFRRAAQTRGADEQEFVRISDFALLRMESPYLRGVDERLQRIDCTGVVRLQLPPKIVTSDGTGSLRASVDYAIQPAADGTGNIVVLGNTDAITVPLATIHRVGGAPVPSMEIDNALEPENGVGAEEQGTAETTAPEQSANPGGPSFDCSNVQSGTEARICSDPGLASLDRDTAWGYSRALSQATPDQRQILQSTRQSFLAYRDRCNSRSCIANAYMGRMREIRDIISGRWQPQ